MGTVITLILAGLIFGYGGYQAYQTFKKGSNGECQGCSCDSCDKGSCNVNFGYVDLSEELDEAEEDSNK